MEFIKARNDTFSNQGVVAQGLQCFSITADLPLEAVTRFVNESSSDVLISSASTQSAAVGDENGVSRQ